MTWFILAALLGLVRFFFAPGDPVLLIGDWGLLLAGLVTSVRSIERGLQ